MQPTNLAVSILPVFAFVLALIWLDSYKLVKPRSILIALGIGGATSLVCYLVNRLVLGFVSPLLVTRYLAPIVEESFKGIYLILLIRLGRVGFMVDAAITGASLGAGFAFIENLYYFQAMPDASVPTWIIRGFGTAIMHSGNTALMGILVKSFQERRDNFHWPSILPGLGTAIAVHSLFNHFLLPPIWATLCLLLFLPTMIMLVYDRSESKLRNWLGTGFDAATEQLELINSGQFSESRNGRYLRSLKASFPGEVVVDMLCCLRLNLELSVRAKGILMMREQGFPVAPDSEIINRFQELRALEQNIGPTGRLAMEPILQRSSRELWEMYMLEKK